ncbi:hypothetical protein ASPCADRAFT_203970, partial [Aspergillus carbonarius ITEM 5010]
MHIRIKESGSNHEQTPLKSDDSWATPHRFKETQPDDSQLDTSLKIYGYALIYQCSKLFQTICRDCVRCRFYYIAKLERNGMMMPGY